MARILVEGLTFSYPNAAQPTLNDVSLGVECGSCVLLTGASGCGKTTLLRHLKSVLEPYGSREGRVLIDGKELDAISLCEQASRIGFVMQNPDAQIVTDKVWHELAFGLESLGVPGNLMRARVAEMASYFGIEGLLHADVNNLSGGQKQLVNLASVMALEPDILVLDEPTAQLDPLAAEEFLATVQRLNQDLGTTVLMAEQRLELVYSKADKVVVLDKGCVLYSGAPASVAQSLIASDHPMKEALPTSIVLFGAPTVKDARICLRSIVEEQDLHVKAVEIDHFPETKSVIRIEDAWFRYSRDGSDVLRGMALQVPSEKLMAIIGGNGAGKSTALKVACGLLRPYRGKVNISGSVAMLPQNARDVFIAETVRVDLEEMGSGDWRAIASELGVDDVLDAHPFDLSEGEVQRAALAKVLLANPHTLLLDEPTKGLDVLAKQRLASILKRIVKNGKTVVIVSHDIEFCAKNADVVSMLFDGQIVATGTPRELFSRNAFYTTAASRISRGIFSNVATASDIVMLLEENGL